MTIFIRASYYEFRPETYDGMEAVDDNGTVVRTEFSTDWQHDLDTLKEWAKQQDQTVFVSSSVDNFLSDVKTLSNYD